MSSSPLVSVITIFLNAERFIEEAIKSVLAQTYRNWELLLVDDGSSDTSTEIARRYTSEKPEQLRYLEHPGRQNRGMSASRNLGICHAKGRYIAFLDADDVWLPHKLVQQIELMNAHPEAGMLYGNSLYWYSWTGATEDKQRDFMPELGIAPGHVIPPPRLLPLLLRGKATVPGTCSIFVKREVAKRVGGFEEAFRGMYEDQVFYVKVCLRTPVLVSDACWDWYRQHPGSRVAIAQRAGLEHYARQAFLEWLADYLIEQRIADSEVWQALREELWLRNYPTWLPSSERARYLVRWTKKWLLRLHERIIPGTIRHRLWSKL